MEKEILNVLFLCTGNSARSIMAEAILNSLGAGKFRAFSAGNHPTGTVNLLALELLGKNRLSASGLHSKSWSEFSRSGAPFGALRIYGMRSGGGGNLSGMARTTDDRAPGACMIRRLCKVRNKTNERRFSRHIRSCIGAFLYLLVFPSRR